MRRFLILAALLSLSPGASFAQTLAITAGAGTLFDNESSAEGVQGTLYLPNQTVTGGIGYQDGRLLFEASDERRWHDWDLAMGSKSFNMSAEGVSLGVAIDGLVLQRKTADDKTLFLFFTGATGTGFNSPFNASVFPQHLGAGALVQHRFQNVTLAGLGAFSGGKRTIGMGADYRYRRSVKLSGSTGFVSGQKYLEAAALFQPVSHLSLYANHAQYFSPFSATGNSLGAALNVSRFDMQANLNESRSQGVTLVGENISGDIRLGSVQVREGFYQSGSKRILTHTGIEKWNHFTATETLSQSDGQNSVQVGGGYNGNRISANVNHGIQFLLNGQGYQQVTSISISVRIRDTVVSGSTVTNPFGKILYGVYGSSYAQTGISVQAGNNRVAYASHGRYVIAGVCHDATGPVDGCAIQIGKALVYSNATGRFEARTNKKQFVIVIVDVSEFYAPGNWRLVSAPKTAEPGETLDIVVSRY